MATASVNTEALGRVTWTQFNRLVKEAGSQTALARNLTSEGKLVAPGTVRHWKRKLVSQRNG